MATNDVKHPHVKLEHGIGETWLTSWTEFHDVVNRLFNHSSYIFRGHRRNDWRLESSLARIVGSQNDEDVVSAVEAHREAFRFSIRGRRALVNIPREFEEYDDIWALGQHHGLATPLLDWTASPYAALVFAFAETELNNETEMRVVWALDEAKVKDLNSNVRNRKMSGSEIEFCRPLSDDNPRLVSQNALFTKSPLTTPIEEWIVDNLLDVKGVVLFKVHIPSNSREECLLTLNKMNINYATLFPDLYGAAKHTNMKLEIPEY